MSYNWQEYITLSEYLKNNPCSGYEESCYRSSVSRAYYGVFGIARNFLIKNGATIPRENTHKFLINEYKNSADVLRKKIGKNLDLLRRYRTNADYEDDISLRKKEADLSCLSAKCILNDLKRIGAI